MTLDRESLNLFDRNVGRHFGLYPEPLTGPGGDFERTQGYVMRPGTHHVAPYSTKRKRD